MSDDWNVQISTKVKGDLINIRGTVAEVQEQLKELATNADEIFELLTSVKQVGLIKGVDTSGEDKPKTTRTNTGNTAKKTGSPPPDDCPFEHEYREFTSKAGNEVKGTFCTNPDRNAQCPAKFVK